MGHKNPWEGNPRPKRVPKKIGGGHRGPQRPNPPIPAMEPQKGEKGYSPAPKGPLMEVNWKKGGLSKDPPAGEVPKKSVGKWGTPLPKGGPGKKTQPCVETFKRKLPPEEKMGPLKKGPIGTQPLKKKGARPGFPRGNPGQETRVAPGKTPLCGKSQLGKKPGQNPTSPMVSPNFFKSQMPCPMPLMPHLVGKKNGPGKWFPPKGCFRRKWGKGPLDFLTSKTGRCQSLETWQTYRLGV